MTNRELLIKALKRELKDPECTNRILFDHLTCPEVPGVGRCPRPEGDDTSCYDCILEWLDKEVP